MDDSTQIFGKLDSEQVIIDDSETILELELKGFGEKENDILILRSFETLYLLYTKKLCLKKSKKEIDFDSFMNICQNEDPEILTKFLIYRDLRTRGYVEIGRAHV